MSTYTRIRGLMTAINAEVNTNPGAKHIQSYALGEEPRKMVRTSFVWQLPEGVASELREHGGRLLVNHIGLIPPAAMNPAAEGPNHEAGLQWQAEYIDCVRAVFQCRPRIMAGVMVTTSFGFNDYNGVHYHAILTTYAVPVKVARPPEEE